VLHLVQGTRATVKKGGRKVLFQWVQKAGRAGTADVARQSMTGAELHTHRKAARLSQKALAQRANLSCSAVKYWERQPRINSNAWAIKRIAKALGISGLMILPLNYARAGGWGVTQRDEVWAKLDAEVELKMVAWRERAALRAARLRVVCGAKTRKDTPCRNLSELGRKRCKFHGGKSTGPKTIEGKAKIAEAQREKWAKWRGKRP
jgi:transcriptional regulator with XRE-family HTH domain